MDANKIAQYVKILLPLIYDKKMSHFEKFNVCTSEEDDEPGFIRRGLCIEGGRTWCLSADTGEITENIVLNNNIIYNLGYKPELRTYSIQFEGTYHFLDFNINIDELNDEYIFQQSTIHYTPIVQALELYKALHEAKIDRPLRLFMWNFLEFIELNSDKLDEMVANGNS